MALLLCINPIKLSFKLNQLKLKYINLITKLPNYFQGSNKMETINLNHNHNNINF